MAGFLDLLLHVDRYLLTLVSSLWHVGLPPPVSDRLRGNRSRRDAVSAWGFAAVRGGRHRGGRKTRRANRDRRADRRRHPRRCGELRRRPDRRRPDSASGRNQPALAPLAESGARCARTRLLRAPWRQGRRHGPLRSHRADVRAVRRRRRRDVVPLVRVLQRRRGDCVGRSLRWQRIRLRECADRPGQLLTGCARDRGGLDAAHARGVSPPSAARDTDTCKSEVSSLKSRVSDFSLQLSAFRLQVWK